MISCARIYKKARDHEKPDFLTSHFDYQAILFAIHP